MPMKVHNLLEPQSCPLCGGSGHLEDAAAQGAAMRELRQTRGFTLEEMAVLVGKSQPYLSDLELGKRRWSVEMVKRYERALAP
jgi:predicted transcriptional regulator